MAEDGLSLSPLLLLAYECETGAVFGAVGDELSCCFLSAATIDGYNIR